MEIISRQIYIDHILRFLNKGMMIALTGQRRVGKSYVLRNLAEIIRHNNPDANIVYINKEKKKYDLIKNDLDLSAYIEGKFPEGEDNYLLIDEVQDIDGFENTLRSLNADEECQIIVTGSNAKMLSSELSTDDISTFIFRVCLIVNFCVFTTLKTRRKALKSICHLVGFLIFTGSGLKMKTWFGSMCRTFTTP